MVGVPGRSKACATCRKRKRGCDRSWPFCGQCQSAGVECGGYGKQHIFLVSTAETDQGGSTRLNKTFYSKDKAERNSLQLAPYRARNTQPSLELLSDKFARSAFEESVVGDFWTCYLPNGRSVSPKVMEYSSIGWVNVAQNLFQDNQTLRKAVLTNAVGLCAREKHLPQLLPSCQQLYGQVLGSVANYLNSGKEKQDIAAILLVGSMLCLYECTYAPGCELFEPKQMEKYFAHVFGFEALMMTKEPSFYARGFAHDVFCDMRIQQISLELQLRKRAPLAEKKWKTIPWYHIEKTPKDIVIDVMADLCGILEQSDSIPLHKTVKDRDSQRQEVLSKCWILHHKMQKWISGPGRPAIEYLSSVSEGLYEATYVPTIEECALGEMALLYCITCVTLYECLQNNSEKPGEDGRPKNIDPRFYCHQMAAFVKLFMSFELGRIVTNMVIFAVLTALQFIKRQEANGDLFVQEKVALFTALGNLQSVILGAVSGVDQASINHQITKVSKKYR